MKSDTIGFFLGKFAPLHTGHMGIIDKMSQLCNVGILLVDSSEATTRRISVSGVDRAYKADADIKEMYKNVFCDEVFSELIMPDVVANESCEFVSKIWAAALYPVVMRYIKNGRYKNVIFFGGEEYVIYLVNALNAISSTNGGTVNFSANITDRSIIQVSATEIRSGEKWGHACYNSRSLFSKVIVVYGNESCGKTTLTKHLGRKFNLPFIEEQARFLLKSLDEAKDPFKMGEIAYAQYIEIEKAKMSSPFVISDTCPLTTLIWCTEFLGYIPLEILHTVTDFKPHEQNYILLHPTVPHVADALRAHGAKEDSYRMFNMFYKSMIRYGCTYNEKFNFITIADEKWADRDARAEKFVRKVLKN